MVSSGRNVDDNTVLPHAQRSTIISIIKPAVQDAAVAERSRAWRGVACPKENQGVYCTVCAVQCSAVQSVTATGLDRAVLVGGCRVHVLVHVYSAIVCGTVRTEGNAFRAVIIHVPTINCKSAAVAPAPVSITIVCTRKMLRTCNPLA